MVVAVALMVAVLTVAACASAAEPTVTGELQVPPTPIPLKLTFMGGYKPQANLPFVAAYVAQEKGFFREQGLNIDIKHALQGEHLKLLLNGDIQVTTLAAESVLKRLADPGVPIVAIALFGQRGEQGFAVLKDSGIQTPKDWEGKTVGYKVFPSPDYLAILKANGVDRSKIKEVSVGFDPRILVEKKVDVYPLFLSNEPDTLRRLGHEVKLFTAADYGVPTLGLTYVTSRDYLAKNPEALERFLKATLQALYWTQDHTEEAVDIVLKYALGEDREHQRYMLQTEMRAAISDLTLSNGFGWMTYDQWKALHDSLVEFDAIKQPIDVGQAFSDELLRGIYRDGRLAWP
jgi:ABC-type nitrate/sulfonate/bicarbonate transport system substrate-binding protein